MASTNATGFTTTELAKLLELIMYFMVITHDPVHDIELIEREADHDDTFIKLLLDASVKCIKTDNPGKLNADAKLINQYILKIDTNFDGALMAAALKRIECRCAVYKMYDKGFISNETLSAIRNAMEAGRTAALKAYTDWAVKIAERNVNIAERDVELAKRYVELAKLAENHEVKLAKLAKKSNGNIIKHYLYLAKLAEKRTAKLTDEFAAELTELTKSAKKRYAVLVQLITKLTDEFAAELTKSAKKRYAVLVQLITKLTDEFAAELAELTELTKSAKKRYAVLVQLITKLAAVAQDLN
jgi:hypothetical protein